MDYKNILESKLLSNDNIFMIINAIAAKFKIKNTAIGKCADTVKKLFNNYLLNLAKFPENDSELQEAVNYLNQLCFDDFSKFLMEKYPNINIIRSPNISSCVDLNNNCVSNNNYVQTDVPEYSLNSTSNLNQKNTVSGLNQNQVVSPIFNQNQTFIPGLHQGQPQISVQNFSPHNIADMRNSPITDCYNVQGNVTDNKMNYSSNNHPISYQASVTDQLNYSLNNHPISYQASVLKCGTDKNNMQNTHNNINNVQNMHSKTDSVISPLSDTTTFSNSLTNFNGNEYEFIIINETEKNDLLRLHNIDPIKYSDISLNNFVSVSSNPTIIQLMYNLISKNQVEYDKIIDLDEVNTLINRTHDNQFQTNNSSGDIKAHQSIKKCVTNKKNKSNKKSSKKNRSEKKVEKYSEESESGNDEYIEIDLDNLNSKSLQLLGERVKELLKLKKEYTKKNNTEKLAEIQEEIDEIDKAIKNSKEKNKKIDDELSDKLNTYISNSKKISDNTEELNLKFDPRINYRDLEKILIGVKQERNIQEISLTSYKIPFNPNNINRFNNVFVATINGKTFNIIIPVGKYDINELLNFISDRINVLEFSVDKKTKLITVSNKMGSKFELHINFRNNIFSLLGFVDNASSYKEETHYKSCRPYNTSANKKIFVNLGSSNKDPVQLKFDEKIKPENPIVLKKTSSGIIMKEIIIKLTDEIGNYYDILDIFDMCLQITYCD